MKIRLFVTLMISVLALTGCAGLAPEMDPPKVTVESVESLPSTGGGPRFKINLRVTNPNKPTLDIAGISYSIKVLDRELISGVTNDVPVIEGYSEETVTLEAGINLFQFVRLLAGLGKSTTDALDYQFSAKIDFNGFIPTQRVEETGGTGFELVNSTRSCSEVLAKKALNKDSHNNNGADNAHIPGPYFPEQSVLDIFTAFA